MLRIPLTSPDTTLLLTPRWADYSGPWQTSLWLLGCALPLALIIWLYRKELRLVRPLTALSLLGLRLLIILALLVILAFQPVVVRSQVEEVLGRVMVAIDRSASIDISDPPRSEAA